jgi:hypothetical protein
MAWGTRGYFDDVAWCVSTCHCVLGWFELTGSRPSYVRYHSQLVKNGAVNEHHGVAAPIHIRPEQQGGTSETVRWALERIVQHIERREREMREEWAETRNDRA